MPRPKSSSRGERRRNDAYSASEPEFQSRTLEVRRVVRMVAGGRRFRFRALVAIGNRQGTVGIGIGKGLSIASAVEKATRRARASCITVPRKNGTIPREVSIKEGAAQILLRPARAGHGIVAGGVIRALCELAGISDISAKVISRSTNAIMNARATMKAFRQLRARVAVAEGRRASHATKNAERREPAPQEDRKNAKNSRNANERDIVR